MRPHSTSKANRAQHIPAMAACALVFAALGCQGTIGDQLDGDGPETNPGVGPIAPGSESRVCTAPSPLVPQRLWRLSNAQYSNAVRDLLGIPVGPTVTGGGESLFSFYSADTETVSDALAFS